MVKAAGLPTQRAVTDRFAEHRLPKSNPSIKVCAQGPGPPKQVEMVWHENVRADLPMRSRKPYIDERVMGGLLS
jgi:hypothetical protein